MAITKKTYDTNLADQKYIHFRKTDASTFASQFPEFRSWLYKADNDLNYINIIGSRNVPVLDDDHNLQLNPDRERKFPTLTEGDIYNMYFLDDIKVMYFNGVPYSSVDDYITSIKWWDGDDIKQDASTHIVWIPKKAITGNTTTDVDLSSLKQSKLSFRDANGLAPVARAIPFFSTVENTFVIDSVYNSFRLNGIEGSKYALTTDIVGSATDNLDTTLTLNSLKNYMLTHGGGGGGGGSYDDTWHSDEDEEE